MKLCYFTLLFKIAGVKCDYQMGTRPNQPEGVQAMQKIKKTRKPYVAIVNGQLHGFFKTYDAALRSARAYRTNFTRSSEEDCFIPIKITYDQAGEEIATIHEE